MRACCLRCEAPLLPPTPHRTPVHLWLGGSSTLRLLPAGAGPLQRAQALGLVCGQQCQVAVVEAAGRHGRRCAGRPGVASAAFTCSTTDAPGRTAGACRHKPRPAIPAAAVEAMRLYVRTLEEEVPDWWAQHSSGAAGGADQPAAAANGVGEGGSPTAAGGEGGAVPPPAIKSRSVAEVVVEGSWVSPYISSDKRPPPRYEHATALIGAELFVVGGNYGARAGWLAWRHWPGGCCWGWSFICGCMLACCWLDHPRGAARCKVLKLLRHPPTSCCRRPLPERHLGAQPGEPDLARADAAGQPRRQRRAAGVQRARGGRGAAAAAARADAHRGAHRGALAGQCGAGGRPRQGAACWRGLFFKSAVSLAAADASAGCWLVVRMPGHSPSWAAAPPARLRTRRSRARGSRACRASCRCGCWTRRRAPGPRCSAAQQRARSCPSRAAATRCVQSLRVQGGATLPCAPTCRAAAGPLPAVPEWRRPAADAAPPAMRAPTSAGRAGGQPPVRVWRGGRDAAAAGGAAGAGPADLAVVAPRDQRCACAGGGRPAGRLAGPELRLHTSRQRLARSAAAAC